MLDIVFLNKWRPLVGVAVITALVAACGGGGVGSGGTGAPQSTGSGTLTGFGSVVLDGVAYDERDASVTAESAPGESAAAALAIGQSIEITFESAGVAKSVAIEARVVAPVQELRSGGLVALSQDVRVNTDANVGPVTLFGSPLTGLASLVFGDIVEVHGVSRRIGESDVIQATRIERRASAPAQLRIGGTIAELGRQGAAQTFKIGALTVEYTNATRVPEGTTLANGQAVVVFGTPAGLDRLAASRVRVINRSSDAGDAQLGGSVSELGAGSFKLNGISVAFAGAIVTPASRSLADGAYVQVRGTYGSDRVLTARHIKIRNNADEPEIVLNGTLFDVDAIARTATVRGTRVDTAGARLRGCPGGLVEGVYVEMTGSLGATAVQAADIQCRSDPAGAILERRGTASGVDTALSRFTLTTGGGAPVAVHWNSATRFVDITVPTLSGRFVHVLGSFSGGVLEAQEVIAVP